MKIIVSKRNSNTPYNFVWNDETYEVWICYPLKDGREHCVQVEGNAKTEDEAIEIANEHVMNSTDVLRERELNLRIEGLID